MERFSPSTKQYLEQQEWYEGRLIDRAIIEADIVENRYEPFESAVQFLQEFHHIVLGGLVFGPSECNIHPEGVTRLGEYLGTKLCPVGSFDVCILLMDVRGRVYLETFDSSLDFYADTTDRAIEIFVQAMLGHSTKSALSRLLDYDEFIKIYRGRR